MSLYKMFLKKLKTSRFIKSFRVLREERGALFVLTALMLPVLLGCLGFAYDAGNLYMHKAKLQNTADAAALAGGRAYVDALSEHATNGVVSSITEEQKNEAIGVLKSATVQNIRNNNPIFANKTGKEEKFWVGEKTTITGENTNITKFFRVNLTEPVHLYFLPVLGIQNNIDVSVYATTKLADTKVTSGGSGHSNPNDAQYNPVMILGNSFLDRDNTNAGQHVTTYYDNGTVYVVNGGSIERARVDSDGDYAVPTHSGGNTTIYLDDGTNVIGQVEGRKVVQTSYDMEAFGEEIKELFIKKQNYSEAQLASYYADMTKWKEGNKAYLEAYTNWLKGTKSYTKPNSFEDAQSIFKFVKSYVDIYEPWNEESTWTKIKSQWVQDGYPLTDSEDELSQVVKNSNLKNNWIFDNGPQESSWQTQSPYNYFININKGVLLRNGNKAPVLSTYTQGLTQAPKISDSKYGNLEYYMTYHGPGKMDPFKTSTISNNSALSGPEHSYFYLSPEAYRLSNDPNVTVVIDGCYVNEQEGITENTPFYLFVEADAKLTNVQIKDLDSGALRYRPIILCYLGSDPVYYNFLASDKNTVKTGIFYSPHAKSNTHVNFNGDKFAGSFIAGSMDMENGRNLTYIDGKEAWGMDFTQNIGFNVNSSGNEVVGGEPTETITLSGRLRLFLKGDSNQNYYYNPNDGVWKWTDISN